MNELLELSNMSSNAFQEGWLLLMSIIFLLTADDFTRPVDVTRLVHSPETNFLFSFHWHFNPSMHDFLIYLFFVLFHFFFDLLLALLSFVLCSYLFFTLFFH